MRFWFETKSLTSVKFLGPLTDILRVPGSGAGELILKVRGFRQGQSAMEKFGHCPGLVTDTLEDWPKPFGKAEPGGLNLRTIYDISRRLPGHSICSRNRT